MSKTLLWVLATHEGLPLLVANQPIMPRDPLPENAEYHARKIGDDSFSPISHREARRYRRPVGRGMSDPFLGLEELSRHVQSHRQSRSIRL